MLSRPGLLSSRPRMRFSATVKTSTSMKCWCTMPIPAAIASLGLAGRADAVDEDRALVGLQQPVEHVHQRRLARAVLTKQAMDLAGHDVQVDRVVGDQVAEPLGDPPQPEASSGRGVELGVTSQSCRGQLSHAEGWDLDSILILPLMMSALRASSSDLSSAGTLESKSWNGAKSGALVLQRADKGLIGEGSVLGRLDRVAHRDIHGLVDARDDVGAVVAPRSRSRRCPPRWH